MSNTLYTYSYRLNPGLGKADLDLARQVLDAHTEAFVQLPQVAGMNAEPRERIVKTLYEQFDEICRSGNLFLANRRKLADTALTLSELQVLCLVAEQKPWPEAFDSPYISGQLYRHLKAVAPHVADLKALLAANPDLDEAELFSFCQTKCFVYAYWLKGFDLLRHLTNDLDGDWLGAFHKSMLIYSEHTLREKAGLSVLITDPAEVVSHGLFYELVAQGRRDPLSEWRGKIVLDIE